MSRLEEHFDSSLFAKRPYPAEFLRYEALDSLHEQVCRALGSTALKTIQPQCCEWSSYLLADDLEALYAGFAKRLRDMPNSFIVENGNILMRDQDAVDQVNQRVNLIRLGGKAFISGDRATQQDRRLQSAESSQNGYSLFGSRTNCRRGRFHYGPDFNAFLLGQFVASQSGAARPNVANLLTEFPETPFRPAKPRHQIS